MITKEMLQNSSSESAYLKKQGKVKKVVLTTDEMQAYLDSGRTSVSTIQFKYNDQDFWFYTDDYCGGKGITWGPNKLVSIESVPSTTQVPHRVAPRVGLEDGLIKNTRDFEFVYCKDAKQISSIDEYLEILNQC